MTTVQVNLLFCHHCLSLSSSFAVDGMECKQGRRHNGQEEKTSKKCVKEMCQSENSPADPAEMICVVHEISREHLRPAF